MLSNARDSEDYDVSKILNQALEYLFYERGDFIRDRKIFHSCKDTALLIGVNLRNWWRDRSQSILGVN
ncbi:MAG: hypothetical protein JGK12_21000 [Microcoleus sp. PH2017_01_SCD_O_A]|uniref:hypothetical protein n=1 Tax=unclassified Microcoleus TaxID=2642155 RepID=UPI001DF7B4E4|nr:MULTISPECIES: hypothetical protein [unclassified Microcoleus]TAF89004.1 MAG: hypothetical protein EAZ49_14720 [Oscillatoriales cyanobacterium]MCC3426320.1 hypothetical protein [Microcoleus sp. PH2017_01_SCD_O_A]MCC3434887.1 hypothetical protein [Microcoleus sp. PH2017_05_CCC_O_A]MCC3447046.1 hypothetical protein [Microcoleus sp. PH2017_09_SFU_O_A]MCC3471303.1 hypothetical protein [Microcoleus sp. PH2017_13_LAR_U_A]